MAAGARRQRDQAQRLPTLAAQFARQRMAIDATQADIDQCGSTGLASVRPVRWPHPQCTYLCTPALQLRGKHVAIERMVLDQQQPHAGQRTADGMSSNALTAARRTGRQAQDEAAAAPHTLCGQVASHRTGQLARWRAPPVPLRWWPRCPCWNGWNSVATGRLDADAAVDHLQQQFRGRAAGVSCRRSSMPPTSLNFTALASRLLAIWRTASASSRTMSSRWKAHPDAASGPCAAPAAGSPPAPTGRPGQYHGMRVMAGACWPGAKNRVRGFSRPRSDWLAWLAAASRSRSTLRRGDCPSNSIEVSTACAELRISWLMTRWPARCAGRRLPAGAGTCATATAGRSARAPATASRAGR